MGDFEAEDDAVIRKPLQDKKDMYYGYKGSIKLPYLYPQVAAIANTTGIEAKEIADMRVVSGSA
ncbi:hypothetical protein SAMN02745975_03605 [Geosporobacter subterraneus DSM 17957]|uniref:Uncharacterized protein n=1 Tax=Geosporobacter subterraneus DSM 17957 TaxID=1121919 RepID=A0A1M6PKG9_9FIRM|nr:hypothetical protein [Geosporobacter subterraneus]SHK08449.1 hypothetical protein SAMN02745975_03605 [Geosporobacter subterraneus DSM 17957]